ncbi:MAG: hypothetical protein CSA58_03225 [Micrococcales bacterium]|nr:MAG: hypothetical protein CSA58_03225 [Micrococcales bacterium]
MNTIKDSRIDLSLHEVRKTAADAGYAVVGVTDIAVERVRDALEEGRHQVQRVPRTSKRLPATAKSWPSQAREASRRRVTEAEQDFADLAARGRDLVGRVASWRPARDLFDQASVAVSKLKGAASWASKAAEKDSVEDESVAPSAEDAPETAEAAPENAGEATTDTATSTPRATETERATSRRAKSGTRAAKAAGTRTRKPAAKSPEAAHQVAQTDN